MPWTTFDEACDGDMDGVHHYATYMTIPFLMIAIVGLAVCSFM